MKRRLDASLPRRLIASAVGTALALAASVSAADDQPAGRPFPAERTCSAIDSSYVSIAEETGGLVLPLSPATLAANAERIATLLAANLASVDLVRGTLADGHRRIEAPVDAGVRRLVVSLCVDEEREVALLDPEGVASRLDGEGGFVLREGRHRIFVVHDPKPGPWAVRVSGSGRYLAWIKVEGGTSVTEADPQAVMDIPLAGSSVEWALRVSGTPRDLRLVLVDGDGAWVAESNLARKDEVWVARLAAPAKPFRIQVTGRDRYGTRFRRTLPRVVRPVPGNSDASGKGS